MYKVTFKEEVVSFSTAIHFCSGAMHMGDKSPKDKSKKQKQDATKSRPPTPAAAPAAAPKGAPAPKK
jgi:hypothetical protein